MLNVIEYLTYAAGGGGEGPMSGRAGGSISGPRSVRASSDFRTHFATEMHGIRKNIALILYSPRGLILHEKIVFKIEFTVNPLPAVETRPYPTWRARSA